MPRDENGEKTVIDGFQCSRNNKATSPNGGSNINAGSISKKEITEPGMIESSIRFLEERLTISF